MGLHWTRTCRCVEGPEKWEWLLSSFRSCCLCPWRPLIFDTQYSQPMAFHTCCLTMANASDLVKVYVVVPVAWYPTQILKLHQILHSAPVFYRPSHFCSRYTIMPTITVYPVYTQSWWQRRSRRRYTKSSRQHVMHVYQTCPKVPYSVHITNTRLTISTTPQHCNSQTFSPRIISVASRRGCSQNANSDIFFTLKFVCSSILQRKSAKNV